MSARSDSQKLDDLLPEWRDRLEGIDRDLSVHANESVDLDNIDLFLESAKSDSYKNTFYHRELDRLLKYISKVYHVSNGGDRVKIRSTFDGLNSVLYYMMGMPSRISKTKDLDAEKLMFGLTIASLQDGRLDARDLLLSIGSLIHAAEEQGLAVGQPLDKAVYLSSEVSRSFLGSMKDMLLRLRDTS